MRVLRMIFLGGLGIIICVMGFFITVRLTDTVYGLVISLLGSLAGGQAVFGYIGEHKVKPEEFKKLALIGTIFGGLAALMPYVFFGFTDAVDILFIIFGALGGNEVARVIYFNKLVEENYLKKHEKKNAKNVSFALKTKIFTKKLTGIVTWYLIFAFVFILIGNLFFPGFGVSWIIMIALIIYEIWSKKIYIITEDDLKKYGNNINL